MIKWKAIEYQRKHRGKSEITGVPRAGFEPARSLPYEGFVALVARRSHIAASAVMQIQVLVPQG